MIYETNTVCSICGESIYYVDNRKGALYCKKCDCHYPDSMKGKYVRKNGDGYFTVFVKAEGAKYSLKRGRLLDIAYEYNANRLDYSEEKQAVIISWRYGFPESHRLYKCITLMDNILNNHKEGVKIKLRELINKYEYTKNTQLRIFDELGKEIDIMSVSSLEVQSWAFDDYMDHFIDKFWIDGGCLCVQLS